MQEAQPKQESEAEDPKQDAAEEALQEDRGQMVAGPCLLTSPCPFLGRTPKWKIRIKSVRKMRPKTAEPR